MGGRKDGTADTAEGGVEHAEICFGLAPISLDEVSQSSIHASAFAFFSNHSVKTMVDVFMEPWQLLNDCCWRLLSFEH